MTHEHNNELPPRDKLWLEVFKSVAELTAFHEEASLDVTDLIKTLDTNPHSQPLRRTIVRNFAALVEGDIFLIKRFTLAQSTVRIVTFSNKTLAQLADNQVYLDEAGKEARARNLSLLCNLKFAVKTFAEVEGFDFELEYNDPRYKSFQQMICIRNRLMHPKSVTSLMISDADFIRTGEAWGWYREQFLKLLNSPRSNANLRTRFTPIK